MLDHIADIPNTFPDQLEETTKLFMKLHNQGYKWGPMSYDAAIRSHNNKLLRLLHEVQPLYDITWCTMHCRNIFALRYCNTESDHFEQIALEDSTEYLGRMRIYATKIEPISVAPFAAMLNGDTQQGRLGFRWLLRNHLIDLDTINVYHHEQIVAIYGERARALLSI